MKPDSLPDDVPDTIKTLMKHGTKMPPHASKILEAMVEIDGLKPSDEVSEEELCITLRLLVLITLTTVGGSCTLRQAERMLTPVIPHVLTHLVEKVEKSKTKRGDPSRN